MSDPGVAGDSGAAGAGTPPGGKRSLTHRAARGVAWTSTLSLIERLATLVMQLVLAGLLPLEVWGAWGIAASLLRLASGFGSSGLRQVLIHRGRSYRLWCGPAMWFGTVWGLLLSGVFLAVGLPLTSVLVEEDWRSSFVTAMLVLAPVPMLASVVTVPRAKLSIDHRFRAAAVAFTVPGILQAAGTIVLAVMGFGLLSFAIPMLGSSALRLVLNLWLTGSTWRVAPRFRRWKYMLGDSGRVWIESIAGWLRTQADVLILGFFADQAAVGLYTFARNMSRQMVLMFTLQVAGVLAPIMASLRRDQPRALSAFLRANRLLAFVGVPVTLGIAAVAWVGMPLLLDPEKWADLPLVLGVMCLGISMRVLTESAVALAFAVGKFREQMRFSIASSIGFCVCLLIGSWLGGVLGASLGFLVFCVVAGPGQMQLSISAIGGRWSQTMASVLVPVAAALASIVPWVVAAEAIELHDAVAVAVVVVGSAMTYWVLARLRGAPELRELVERVGEQAPARYRPTIRRLGALLAGVRPA